MDLLLSHSTKEELFNFFFDPLLCGSSSPLGPAVAVFSTKMAPSMPSPCFPTGAFGIALI